MQDAPKPDAKLKVLVRRGAQRIDTEARAREQQQRDVQQSKQARLDSARDLSPIATWQSISAWGTAWFWGLVLLFASFLGLPLSVGLGASPVPALSLIIGLVCLLVVSWHGVQRARRRTFAFVRNLPFRFEGYEQALRYGAAVSDERDSAQTRHLMLRFERPGPPGQVVAQALAAVSMCGVHRPYPPLTVTGLGTGYRITLQGGSTFSSHCRWLARSMPRICEVLCALHSVYPIKLLQMEPPPD